MLYQSKLQSGGGENILRVLFSRGKKQRSRCPPLPPSLPPLGMERDTPPRPALQAKHSLEKSCPPSPSPLRKKEGWPGAPYLAELPRFYILLLPFVKFQMETSNISRGNQPNIGQRVKSKRMAELSLSPSAPSTRASTYIYTYTLYIYIYMYILNGKRKKKS